MPEERSREQPRMEWPQIAEQLNSYNDQINALEARLAEAISAREDWQRRARVLEHKLIAWRLGNGALRARMLAAEARAAALETALQKAHDLMDDENADAEAGGACMWCGMEGYDGDGLLHQDECPLIILRAALSTPEAQVEAEIARREANGVYDDLGTGLSQQAVRERFNTPEAQEG